MPIPKNHKPLEKSLVRKRVYTLIKKWIIEGSLIPGEKLNDLELSKQLGVSRTPVRESLRSLEDEGLVETSAHKWTRVSIVDLNKIKLLYPIVKQLETMALELFVKNVNSDDLDELKKLNMLLLKAIDNNNIEKAIDYDYKFHLVFIEQSGNTELLKIIEPIKERLMRAEIAYFKKYSIPIESLKEHEGIINSLAERNLKEAIKQIGDHWDNGLNRLLK